MQSSYFLRRPQKLTKSSLSILRYVVSVKSTEKILSVFVAFLKNMNFTRIGWNWNYLLRFSHFKTACILHMYVIRFLRIDWALNFWIRRTENKVGGFYIRIGIFGEILVWVFNRRLMGSIDQAYPSCFCFRISWILMEWHFFLPPPLCVGPQK